MGKGALDFEDPRALGTVGLHDRDYALAGFDDADVVIAIGYDLVEHAPEHWNPRRDKTIVVLDTVPAEIDGSFTPAVELIGNLPHVLARLTEECRDRAAAHERPISSRLRDVVLGRLQHARDDEHFPMQPPRALWELRQALGRDDVLVSDVGLHKLWIGRMFGAHEPNTVVIANGLAGMGFALPCAIAAKIVQPQRNVVAVCGDGGFLMNVQELETAVRLRTPVVCVVWEDRRFGSIAWKQQARFGETFGVDFTNPDFVKLAESFGMAAWRCAVGGRLRAPSAPCARPRRTLVDRAADRLLDRRRDLGRAWRGDGDPHMSTTSQQASAERAALDAVPKQLYIGGTWRDGAEGKTVAVEDPATGETIAEVADATTDDALDALGAAHDAFAAWRETAPRERGEILRRAYEAVVARSRRARAADDARDGQAAGGVQGRDRLRRRLPALVLRGGRAHRRALHDPSGRQRPAADDEAARRPVRLHHAVELPAGDGHAQDRPGDRRRLHDGRQAGEAHAAVDARAGADPRAGAGCPAAC